jgi:calcium-dependent protein kinase
MKIDMDGSGAIDYTEWTVGTINKANVITKSKLRKAFEMFDLDGSGRISATELKTVLGQIQLNNQSMSSTTTTMKGDQGMADENIWKKMIEDADIDGDGEISFEEFEKLMTLLLYNQN